jgi:hypothetical protein
MFNYWTQMAARKDEYFCVMSSSGLREAYPSITENEAITMMEKRAFDLEKEGYIIEWEQMYYVE